MSKLLVTGAAGQLGRRVVANLIERNGVAPADIIAGSRDPEKLADLAALGVATRRIDFEAPALATAFAGADRALIISTDVLGRPGVRLAQHKAAVAAAAEAGVKHIVYTSMPNPEKSVIPFAPDHLGTEQAIKATGIGYTILRNGWYMENLFMALPKVLASGQWFSATGDGRTSYITREDCARAAAAALAAGAGESRTYTLTGPEALTTAAIASAASSVAGKPITVVPVTDDQLLDGIVAAGLPAAIAPIIASFDRNTRLGLFDIVTDAVEALTGTAPTPLNAFLGTNKAALAG